ncbi:hypothetical protein [Aquimarina rhabdastrellae]
MKKTKISHITIHLITIISCIVISIAPFIHINFPKKEKSVIILEQKISELTSKHLSKTKKLRSLYDDKRISAENYIIKLDLLNNEKQRTLSELRKELQKNVADNRMFGFRTKRVFLIGFGIRLPYLFFSLSILGLFLYNKKKLKKDRNLYIAVKMLYNISFLISFFIVAWFLIPRQDFDSEIYYLMIGLLSILSSFLSIYLIKHYIDIFNSLKFKIRTLISFIKVTRKKYLELAVESAITDPNNQEKIKQDIKDYDDELFHTLKKVNDR